MQLSRYIDHTLLKPEAQTAQIEKLCAEAKEHNFFSVCVNTSYVKTCAELLKDSSVKVCCVVGFPLGAMDTTSKAFETKTAIANGAQEIDMVIQIGALKDRRLDYVRDDIKAVVQAANGHTVKVIIETSLLNQEDKTLACKAALEAGAHFVKTSTGFGGGGATVDDVKLMKSVVGSSMEVKASGGIKDAQQAKSMIDAGATRLGTSSGITIIQGGSVQGGY
ncbi:deoxyribose-phosphate aldolase [Bdellovibrio bacteriovorus]|uniref:Deoxyribose-phosphate aldolase n=1 Tax=Bdellovibrio bacteriovorus (strain ATCC 15356 / DSM 50701 / NCIMB 9529 / HD100) TaxID=264462 RepID=DEOC_BDEBA|nr:deoxyribose-phosphate aldolase [Bdellovibrio bacteriovorus]Q6MGR8.1 RecName: Full=Deoxyribose-phosphate aldolase; Short=DERA; AltName: Full=2-deoxy-D-ribose 5-phosphate aldolase; AltName: Full=Phosphodeoxyriboaldolase; Short=Deoxyriboaldolase [Bdellovibrio bacteriovorus HD100]CAE81211.1 dra [Bdellovibrio bacteriovorus HD100]